MKCLILAGGLGERLWPLSRKNYPKQFIQIQKKHSLFQEAIARNIPYCDEFIIITNYEYRYIIDTQMKIFQGVTYRCIYEEVPRKTAVAITLACMELQPSELVFIVSSDHLIDTINNDTSLLNYNESVLKAKKLALDNKIVLLDIKRKFTNNKEDLKNTGLWVFENGVFQNTLKKTSNAFFRVCQKVFEKKVIKGNTTIYLKEFLETLPAFPLKEILYSNSTNIYTLSCDFLWSDVGSLDDLITLDCPSPGLCINYKTRNTVVVNNSSRQAVVLNNTEDLIVVNTADVVYIGKANESRQVENILNNHLELAPYTKQGTTFYRSWGYYEQLSCEMTYRVRRVILYPGKTIYAHKHNLRSENWTITSGTVQVTLNGILNTYTVPDNIDIPIGVIHQISNIGKEDAIFVETACGEIIHEEQDMLSDPTEDLNEQQLGISIESFIKLTPSFKDYLWGGNRLKQIYLSDYKSVAESWELSAHSSGQSIVSSGRHKGMLFTTYIETVGKEVLGWKCQSMVNFPILIKFIDANKDLSIQVHPNDDYALEHEHEYGKNEMWYIWDCEKDSSIYLGFNRDVSKEEVILNIKNNTLTNLLNQIPTHPGDVFFIPAGTIHAIGAGNLIYEIQQNSNSTYRIYDYNRTDKYGNLRELHLEKALSVLNYQKYLPKHISLTKNISEKNFTNISLLGRCKYFESKICIIKDFFELSIDESRFVSVICIDGSGKLISTDSTSSISSGDSYFIPAKLQTIKIIGNLQIIISHI